MSTPCGRGIAGKTPSLSDGNDESLRQENEDLKRLLEKKGPLVSGDVWQEVERLKERNRQLRLKIGAERQENIEKISDLEDQLAAQKSHRDKSQAELAELRSQLATERADREEVEVQLADLKQNSAPASELPEAADLLNRLKTKRKKSSVTLADVETLLELLEG